MTGHERIIVTKHGVCDSCATSTVQVHHRDYPEVRAEGMSAASAAEQLLGQLGRSLDHTPDREHREALEQALTEVRGFLEDCGCEHDLRGGPSSSPQAFCEADT